MARLIYHPRRARCRFGGRTVYFDSTTGNQDPYVWNDAFLHSYCHITQFHAVAGDVNLWVSGDRFPAFTSLYCDLVFVVDAKCPWADANYLSPDDPLVDTAEAWADHYRWHQQHHLTRRSRFTLKADRARSFQAQADDGSLIDVVPALREHGISLGMLQAGMRAGTGSQPMTIPLPAATFITGVLSKAPVILQGPALRKIRQDNPDLESEAPNESGPTDDGSHQTGHGTHCRC